MTVDGASDDGQITHVEQAVAAILTSDPTVSAEVTLTNIGMTKL